MKVSQLLLGWPVAGTGDVAD